MVTGETVPSVPVGPAVVELGKPKGADDDDDDEELELLWEPVGPTEPVPRGVEDVAPVGPWETPVESPVPDDPVAEIIPVPVLMGSRL